MHGHPELTCFCSTSQDVDDQVPPHILQNEGFHKNKLYTCMRANDMGFSSEMQLC